MDADIKQLRDDCRQLAYLLDEAENASGPWLFIPQIARRLYEALGKKLGEHVPKQSATTQV